MIAPVNDDSRCGGAAPRVEMEEALFASACQPHTEQREAMIATLISRSY